MRRLPAVIVTLALAGCATGYKPDGIGGGYSDAKYGPNIFSVTVRGNGVTSFDRATELAMLRSAEITLTNGFTHFIIADKAQEAKTGSFVTPSSTYTTGTVNSFGNTAYLNAQSTTTGGQRINISKPLVSFKIETFNGAPDRSLGLAYDARSLCESLGDKYDAVCPPASVTAPPKPATAETARADVRASASELTLAPGWNQQELTQAMVAKGWKLYALNKTIDAGMLYQLSKRAEITDGAMYARTLRSNQAAALEKSSWSELQETTINGRKAWRFWVTGLVKNGTQMQYLGTVVEGRNNYAFVNAWSTHNNFESNKSALEAVSEGLSDI